jgi:hypothetical protein
LARVLHSIEAQQRQAKLVVRGGVGLEDGNRFSERVDCSRRIAVGELPDAH